MERAGTVSRSNGDDRLVIGLVNNMVSAAMQATERQFRDLLSIAAHGRLIQLRVFCLPALYRADGEHYGAEACEPIDALWSSELDGLIVTGTVPRASALRNEPILPALCALVDWAVEHTLSSIWSCLAAQAAVLHLDGIDRRPLPQKLSGVYECGKACAHPLLAGLPSRWPVPHSRYNELPEPALVAKGYRVLSGSPEVGADIFVKENTSLFVLLQGHPEYDPATLLREYRRDVGRFLAGQRDAYPEMPHGYFDPDIAAAFEVFRVRATRTRDPELLGAFPAPAGERLTHPWRDIAVRLYEGWLSYLAERKQWDAAPDLSRPVPQALTVA
jgi:homoserine O-succinyltransferase/O-acetyltransferase